MLAIGITSSADFTDSPVATPRRAVLPTVKDNLQMERVPAGFWEGTLQVSFSFCNVATAGDSPSLGKAMDMGVHGESRHAKCLRHDHAGGFVADTR